MNAYSSSHANWYVLYTYPNFEKKVHHALQKAQINSYLPLQRVAKKWSDRTKVVEAALFPNYVFIQVPENEKYKASSIYGVSRFVSFGGKPATLSEKEIGIVRQLTSDPSVHLEENLAPGDPIVVTEGPFNGLRGTIFERKGKTRLGVKIQGISQFLSVELPVHAIKKLESPSGCC